MSKCGFKWVDNYTAVVNRILSLYPRTKEDIDFIFFNLNGFDLKLSKFYFVDASKHLDGVIERSKLLMSDLKKLAKREKVLGKDFSPDIETCVLSLESLTSEGKIICQSLYSLGDVLRK